MERAHAHNDYDNDPRLFAATKCDFKSVEADICEDKGELLVAHNCSTAHRGDSLETIYLNPLRHIVEKNGGAVYPGDPDYFTLLLDIKSITPACAAKTYNALVKKLKSYRGMLTSFGPDGVHDGAITIIVSGHRPSLERLQRDPVRYAALDGRLDDLGIVTDQTVMPLISANWDDAKKVDWRAKVQTAHANGQRVRFWNTPDKSRPKKSRLKRNAIWHELLAAKVDHINTDNLEDLHHFLTRYDLQSTVPWVSWTEPPLAPPIVFTSTRDGNPEIYRMAPEGSGQTRLTSNNRSGLTNVFNGDWNPVLSPDGSAIAFSSNRGDVVPGAPRAGDGSFKVYTMAADGSRQSQITHHGLGNGEGDYETAFSPDGARIAFRRVTGGVEGSEIYTVGADGSDEIRLTNNAVGDSQPVFSPDGTRIAFVRKGDGQFNSAIYTMAIDGSDERQLTNTDAGVNTDTHPAYSPDGRRIAFTSDRDGRGGTEIYIMAIDGSGQTRLTTRPVSSDTSASQPAFSPDGTRIAFERAMEPTVDDYASHRNEIYTMAIDGSDWLRLTYNQGPNGTGFDGEPHWGAP